MRNTRHKPSTGGTLRQRGAVILLVTFSLLFIFGLAALVLDLGRMFIIKNQLQNAADSGALRGAKELDGSAAQCALATAKARDGANQNAFLLVADRLDVSDSDQLQVYLSDGPDGGTTGWVQQIPGSCTGDFSVFSFVRVDTAAQGIHSLFAGVLGIETNAAKALAVAGKSKVDVTPIGVCAITPDECPSSGSATTTPPECGFVRGWSYNFDALAPLGPGTPFWLSPLATNQQECQDNPGDTGLTATYVCSGQMVKFGNEVFTNTGVSAGQVQSALNSRFGGNNNAPFKYTREACSPDTNIMSYTCDPASADCLAWPNQFTAQGMPSVTANWQTPLPSRQAVQATRIEGDPVTFNVTLGPSVLWSYSRPVDATVTDNWPVASGTSPNNYPGAQASYPGSSPYAQTAAPYFQAPSVAQGSSYAKSGRRVLKVVIVRCQGAGGVCRPLIVEGVGKFFMQRPANLPGDVGGEFAGMVPKEEYWQDVKLYR